MNGVYGLNTGIHAPSGVCLVSSEAKSCQQARCDLKDHSYSQIGSIPVTVSSSGSLNFSFLTLWFTISELWS